MIGAAALLVIGSCGKDSPPAPPPALGARPPLVTLALALGPWPVVQWPLVAGFAEQFVQQFSQQIAQQSQLLPHRIDLGALARRAAREREAGTPITLGEGEERALLLQVATALYATPRAQGALLGEPPPGCPA